MSRIVTVLSAVVGLNYFLACCQCEERPPVDPSKVVVVCANGGDAEQTPEEFDSGDDPLGASRPKLTEANVCVEACRTLAALKCSESKKLPEGDDCPTVCKNVRPLSSYDPYCVARARTVTEVRKCPRVECKP